MKTVTVLILLTLTAIETIAQTNAPPVFIDEVDVKVQGFFAAFTAWKFMLVPITLILVKGVKVLFTKIPTNYLPWIAPLIGGILDYAATKAGIWTGSGEIGMLMGGLAVWAHQTGRETTALVTVTNPVIQKPADASPPTP